MNRTTLLLGCSLLLLPIGGCASNESASADSASKREAETVSLGVAASSRAEDDEAVTLAQCPAAVRTTIEAHLNGGSIVEIERTTDHGEVLYEVDVRGADGVAEFDVAEDGTFRGFEADDDDDDGDEGDEAVTLDQCPAAVQATIKAHLDGGSIVELERTTDHGEVLYEVDVRGADGIVEFDVAEDGTFRGYEEDDDDGDGEDDEDDD